jgi:hypothetical protein
MINPPAVRHFRESIDWHQLIQIKPAYMVTGNAGDCEKRKGHGYKFGSEQTLPVRAVTVTCSAVLAGYDS